MTPPANAIMKTFHQTVANEYIALTHFNTSGNLSMATLQPNTVISTHLVYMQHHILLHWNYAIFSSIYIPDVIMLADLIYITEWTSFDHHYLSLHRFQPLLHKNLNTFNGISIYKCKHKNNDSFLQSSGT